MTVSFCGPIGVGGECYYVLTESGCVDGAFCAPARSAPVAMGSDAPWDNAVCRVLCDAPGDCVDAVVMASEQLIEGRAITGLRGDDQLGVARDHDMASNRMSLIVPR